MNACRRLIACLFLIILLVGGCSKQQRHYPQYSAQEVHGVIPRQIIPTPQWIIVQPLRSFDPSLGWVLGDIDSHMPAWHIYRENDRVTWSHETTHGLNSRIRGYYGGTGTVNAFYSLKNRAAVIAEPRTTILEVARYVPASLRGNITWSLYMNGSAQREWNTTPLYIVDELSAYTNGSNGGLDLACRGMWTQGQRSDTLQNMLDFQVYSMTAAWLIKNRCPTYDDKPLKTFLMWEIYRGRELVKYSKYFPDFASQGHDTYCQTLATSPDADRLRRFIKAYFGTEWTQAVLGF